VGEADDLTPRPNPANEDTVSGETLPSNVDLLITPYHPEPVPVYEEEENINSVNWELQR
jgi:hypothetical protein